MNTNTKYLKSLASIIIGHELGIVQILEKWKVSDRDIDKVIDRIAMIEEDTINLTLEKRRLENVR